MKAILARFLAPIVCASLVGVIAFAGDAAAVTNATPFSAAGCGIVVNGAWSNFVPGPFLVARSQNGAISNPDSTSAHDVTCPMPRVGSSAARLLYIDGNNNGGGSTSCTVFSYSFDGNLLASANTGTLTAASFDTPLSLPAGSIYDYLTLKCSLSTSSRSILRGYVVVE